MRLSSRGNILFMKPSRRIRRGVAAAALTVSALALASVAANAALNGAGDSTTAPEPSATSTSAANGSSQDAHAIVVNHGDNRYRYAITLKIVQVSGDVVDPQNAAVAVAANCSDCETVAISLEGVLVYGDPTVFAPENIALAYNENCSNCATLAAAYQEIVQTSNRVRITGAGRQQIAAIRQDLESIRHDNLSLAEIDTRVNADAAALLQVLRDDVVAVGKPHASASPQPLSSQPTPASATPGSASAPPPTGSPSTSAPSPDGTPTDSPSPTESSGSSPIPTASG